MAKAAGTTSTREASVETRSPDEFAAVLKQSFKRRRDGGATEVENAVTTLVHQALADTTVIKDDVLENIEGMIARLDEKLAAQMNEVVHAREFQQIESAWRGLHYLCFNSETDSNLKMRVMNVSKNEIYRNLRLYPGARWDQSPLFKAVYEAEFGQLGGEPFGCMVGDYYFSHQPTDVQLLRDLSKVFGSAHAPFFAGADPTLLGMDAWTELSNPRDLSKVFDTPEYAAWKGLRDQDDSIYVGLCMPRVLSRLPYGAKSEPVEEFAFEEDTDGHKGENYAWMNAAYAMAVNVNRAFKEWGWCTRIRGVQSGGEVINLPTHTFPTDDGGVDLKCPTEIDAAVVGREGVRRQVDALAAGLDAADAGTPAPFLERAVDVDRHRIGGIHPGVVLALVTVGVLLEGELLDRLGLRAVGQTRQHARHAQSDVDRVVLVAQALPGRIFRRVEHLAEIARIGEFGPGVHAEQSRIGAGEERRVRRSEDLAEVAQQLHVGRLVAEV